MSDGGKCGRQCWGRAALHMEASLSKDLEEVWEWAPRVSGKGSAGRGHAGKVCGWREHPGSWRGWSGVSKREGSEP